MENFEEIFLAGDGGQDFEILVEGVVSDAAKSTTIFGADFFAEQVGTVAFEQTIDADEVGRLVKFVVLS